MEHIIQFGVSIDDERIIKSIEERAYKELAEKLKREADICMYNKYGHDYISDLAKDTIKGLIEAYKEEIIEKAIEVAANKIARSKSFKDGVKDKSANRG